MNEIREPIKVGSNETFEDVVFTVPRELSGWAVKIEVGEGAQNIVFNRCVFSVTVIGLIVEYWGNGSMEGLELNDCIFMRSRLHIGYPKGFGTALRQNQRTRGLVARRNVFSFTDGAAMIIPCCEGHLLDENQINRAGLQKDKTNAIQMGAAKGGLLIRNRIFETVENTRGDGNGIIIDHVNANDTGDGFIPSEGVRIEGNISSGHRNAGNGAGISNYDGVGTELIGNICTANSVGIKSRNNPLAVSEGNICVLNDKDWDIKV